MPGVVPVTAFGPVAGLAPWAAVAPVGTRPAGTVTDVLGVPATRVPPACPLAQPASTRPTPARLATVLARVMFRTVITIPGRFGPRSLLGLTTSRRGCDEP